MMLVSRYSRYMTGFVLIFALASGLGLFAQQAEQNQPQQQQGQTAKPPQSQQASPKQAEPGINEEFGTPLAKESAEAAGAKPEGKEDAQEKMVEGLKHSPSVQKMAKLLHITPDAAYWVGIIIDFALLALLILWAMKKNLPAMFRTRTQTIQRGIEEARRASEEANRRLSDIESRLARLDSEVSSMRAAAEQEIVAEEARIRAAAEEDARRIVASAENEIASTAKQATRELKAFAVDLAVGLAEKRVKVDAATDHALVQRFVADLSATGEPGANGGKGKDGR